MKIDWNELRAALVSCYIFGATLFVAGSLITAGVDVPEELYFILTASAGAALGTAK